MVEAERESGTVRPINVFNPPKASPQIRIPCDAMCALSIANSICIIDSLLAC